MKGAGFQTHGLRKFEFKAWIISSASVFHKTLCRRVPLESNCLMIPVVVVSPRYTLRPVQVGAIRFSWPQRRGMESNERPSFSLRSCCLLRLGGLGAMCQPPPFATFRGFFRAVASDLSAGTETRGKKERERDAIRRLRFLESQLVHIPVLAQAIMLSRTIVYQSRLF